MVNENSKIEFHRLRTSDKSDNNGLYALVRWDTDDSLRVDRNVLELVKQLQHGKTVKEAVKEIKFSTEVVLTMLKMLDDVHFFKEVDGVPVIDKGQKIKPWLTHIDKKRFQWILYKPFLILLANFIISGIALGLWYFGFPSYKSFFWTKDLFVVFTSLFVFDILLTIIHESAHFLVTKAVGGEAVMRISYRYIFIVAETESYHLAIIPKKMRYYVYLAGIIVDLSMIAFIYWVFIFSNILHIQTHVTHNLLNVLLLMITIGIIWEFNVFIETDIYNVLSEYLDMENLRSDAIRYMSLRTKGWNKIILTPIRQIFSFFFSDYSSPTDDLRLLSRGEKKKMFIYIIFLVVGIILTTFQYIFYSIPRDLKFIIEALTNGINAVYATHIIEVIKSLIIISLLSFEYFLLFYFKIRNKKQLIRRQQKNVT